MIPDQGRGLVAIAKTPMDLDIAKRHHWYRIPVVQVKRSLARRWPPQWLALYLPKVFGDEAFTVRYWAKVTRVENVSRLDLFPREQNPKKINVMYHKLNLSPLQELVPPIPSDRYRRIVFIPTTWKKLIAANEINDLWDNSPLEDEL